MGKKALKDLPLQELTLRRYEEPSGIEGRELVKKFLLSVGLLNPGESRDIIVDILQALLEAKKERRVLCIEDFLQRLHGKQGASAPNVRRQLRRLRGLKLVEKLAEGYRISEFGSVKTVVEGYMQKFLVHPAMARIAEYAEKLDSAY